MFSEIQFKHTVILLHLSDYLNIIQIKNMKKRLFPWYRQSYIHIILDSLLTLSKLRGDVKFIFDVLKIPSVIHIGE